MNAGIEIKIRKLVRFGVTTPDAERLAKFYETALSFERLAAEYVSGERFEEFMGVKGGAKKIVLGLGREVVELIEFDRPGESYPCNSRSSDLIFQHFAIVVSDIEEACRRLSKIGRLTAISRGGPQKLPQSAGGVSAFKFRDPDGHPLEFLAFPESPSRPAHSPSKLFLGIDHSAIGVANIDRSVAFYGRFGLRVVSRSHNRGDEQAKLDGLEDPQVEVVALVAEDETPHLELLCYGGISHGRVTTKNNDVAATRLVFEAAEHSQKSFSCSALDPDGHHLQIIAASESRRFEIQAGERT